jgi:hypothetical protein
MHAAPFDYMDAIANAETSPTSDRRDDLRRCLRNWQTYKDARNAFADHVNRSGVLRSGRFVLFEIGNSGFPRFGSLVLQNSTLESSTDPMGQKSLDIHGSALDKLFSRLTERDVLSMQGQAYSEIDDGDCYFLTVGVGPALKHVAIYGKPSDSTAVGQLVGEILRNTKQDKKKR